LDKLSKDENYKSELKVRSFEVPLPAVKSEELKFGGVLYVYKDLLERQREVSVKLRFSNTLVFCAEAGEEIEFEFGFFPKGKRIRSYAEIKLYSQAGDLLAIDKSSLYRKGVIKYKALVGGSYYFHINSHGNMATVVKNSHLYSIVCDKTVHLLKPGWQIYLYKPRGVQQAVLKLDTDGIFESISATLINEQGHVYGTYSVARGKEIKLSGLRREGEVVRLLVEPAAGTSYEDVRIRVISGFSQYISPWREGLVVSGRKN
jgi:hypothetical protein